MNSDRSQLPAESSSLSWAALSALGVVFGDLGTSPLYTLQTVVQATGGRFTAASALGVLSLIVWTLLITISVKYCLFVMRADNRGEGGILALMSLVGANSFQKGTRLLAGMGLLGAALIYYYPLLSANPGPRRIPYGLRAASLFTMMFPETMTGFFIYASNYLLYPYYGRVHRPFGPSPITDQQLGGALMWAGSMLIDSVWVIIAVVDWLRSEGRLAERIDMQTLRELPALPGRPS